AYGPQNDVTLKMPAFEWVHVQLHQQKGMISLSPPTICNSAPFSIRSLTSITRHSLRLWQSRERNCRAMCVSGNVKMTPQQHLKIDPLG
ncbi:hypothetical protein, partial [Klebsiella pneumoniae]|uniref:hypothetical protein n=1 Tax=Klebsiella pneumoniae TaxID=573 RepID=UPI001C5307F9